MAAPHGHEPLPEKLLFRHTTDERKFLLDRAQSGSTSLNTTLRQIVQAAMPPSPTDRIAAVASAVVAAIEAHKVQCPLCGDKRHPQCVEGGQLRLAFEATLPPAPEPPAPQPAPRAPRRALKPPPRRGLLPGLDPVPPVTGQVPFEGAETL